MDAWLNPSTRDYASDTAMPGALQRDPANGVANAVYLRLMTPLGSYWAAPSLGSNLYKLQRSKALTGIDLLARGYALAALQPLLDDGRATSIDVQAHRSSNTITSRLVLLVTVVDAGGDQHVFEHHVKVI